MGDEAVIQHKVALLRRYFFNREDRFAFKASWGTACPGFLSADAETTFEEIVIAHVAGPKVPEARVHFRTDRGISFEDGHHRIGSYCPAPDGTVEWFCIDFDGGDGHKHALADALAAALSSSEKARELGLDVYLEQSRSGHGWHVWGFVDPATPAWRARALGLLIVPPNASALSKSDPPVLRRSGPGGDHRARS